MDVPHSFGFRVAVRDTGTSRDYEKVVGVSVRGSCSIASNPKWLK